MLASTLLRIDLEERNLYSGLKIGVRYHAKTDDSSDLVKLSPWALPIPCIYIKWLLASSLAPIVRRDRNRQKNPFLLPS
jgi:hypothetical protein